MLMSCTDFTSYEYQTIKRAINIVTHKLREEPVLSATSPETTADYLRLLFHGKHEREHFLVLFLDTRNKLIASEFLFSGTVNRVEVHPGVIAKTALAYNAQALILAHNHPAGLAEPSADDIAITQKILEVAQLLDLRLLDHIIIPSTGADYYSFALHGML